MDKQLDQSNSVEDKIAKTNAEVEKVLTVMDYNLQRIVDRGDKLEDLTLRTNALVNESTTFVKTTHQIKKKLWWQNLKVTIVLGVIGTIILVIIIWVVINMITQ